MFFKARPDVVTPENLDRDVLVSSMMDSPVSALYHALHNVYAPLLLKDAKWSTEFDPKLQVRTTCRGLEVTRRWGWATTVGESPYRPFLVKWQLSLTHCSRSGSKFDFGFRPKFE